MANQRFYDKFVDFVDGSCLKMSVSISNVTGFPHIDISDRTTDFYSRYFKVGVLLPKVELDKSSDECVLYTVYTFVNQENVLNMSKEDFMRLLEYRDCLKKLVKLLNDAKIPMCDYFNGTFISSLKKAHTKVNRRMTVYNKDLFK